MVYKILKIVLILQLGAIYVYGQNTVPVDLAKLSKITLSKSPVVKQNILTVSRENGNLQVQKSAFDYRFNTGISLNNNALNLFEADPRNDLVNEQYKLKSSGANIGLQKTFRSSLMANLTVDYGMASDNLPFNNFSENVGAYMEDHNVSSTFSLTQPLLRGRGRTMVTALEETAKLNLESTDSNVQFANSFELYQMSSAYWQYLMSYKNLMIFHENEARVRRVLEITKELVNSDKRPAGDLAQVQADLANQERQTKTAEQTLYRAQLNLGRTIGLSKEDSKLIGDPLDEFPTIAASGYVENIQEAQIIAIAQHNRADIEATKKMEEALKLQLKFTENNIKPQLNLTGYLNYGGMSMGNGFNRAIESFYRKEGSNLGYGLSLNFAFPFSNHLAKGNLIQSKAALKDREIKTLDLQRNIELNVSIALNNLNNSVEVLGKAKEALKLYQEVYNNEQEKFKNGLTILLNLIQFQERLTFAELDYLRAQQQFAEAILNIRYETGTLLMDKSKGASMGKEVFITIPE